MKEKKRVLIFAPSYAVFCKVRDERNLPLRETRYFHKHTDVYGMMPENWHVMFMGGGDNSHAEILKALGYLEAHGFEIEYF